MSVDTEIQTVQMKVREEETFKYSEVGGTLDADGCRELVRYFWQQCCMIKIVGEYDAEQRSRCNSVQIRELDAGVVSETARLLERALHSPITEWALGVGKAAGSRVFGP